MTVADNEIQVVLVKPGDVLLIGNVGRGVNVAAAQAVIDGLNGLGVKAFVFAADIEIDKIPNAQVE